MMSEETSQPIAAPMVRTIMISAMMSDENAQLSQLQTQVVELEHMLEESPAHQPKQDMQWLSGATLGVLGMMGMGGALMHANSDSSNGQARSRLAGVTMTSTVDGSDTPPLVQTAT